MTMTMERQPDFAALRTAMVASQLRTNAVSDARVVAAMANVPRERFVPADQAPFAYRDGLVELGGVVRSTCRSPPAACSPRRASRRTTACC